MKKFLNNPSNFVEESLAGILAAHKRQLKCHSDDQCAVSRAVFPSPDKVSIVTGGGFGHLPVFMGYVGEGLCDGAAVGNVFSSPSSDTIFRVTQSVPHGGGVVYLCGNYMGDMMNFEMAQELAQAEGIETSIVVVSDDASSAPRLGWKDRRAISGIVFAFKIAGAAAQLMLPLPEVVRVTQKAIAQMSSFGVSFEPCQLPSTSHPIYNIGEDEMELGVGIHGERGVIRTKWQPSNEIAAIVADKLADDLSLHEGAEVAVLVNGLGATCQEEQFIYYHDIEKRLTHRGIQVTRSYVGEYVTTMEMSGAMVTIMRLDDELTNLLDQPARTPFVSF